MIITAESYVKSKGIRNIKKLSNQEIYDHMEGYAQKFWAYKVQQAIIPNDTYAEIKRPKLPPQPITEQP